MRLDARLALILGASLLWGLLVAAFFYRISAHARPQPAAAGRQLVTAAHALPVGAVVTREDVRLRTVPEALYTGGGFARVEDVVGRPVIAEIQADEPLLDARLAARGSGLGLAPLIPPGMRAIAVRVNDVVGVAGFVLPGMRVDVLVSGRPPNRADTVTRTVLQNIAVLSAGQTTQSDGKSQSINVPVVTLLVTPDEAEAVTLANNEGHVQLVLRNSSDAKLAATRGRELHELFGISPAPAQPPAASHAAAARTRKPQETPAVTHISAPAPQPERIVVMNGTHITVVDTSTPETGERK